MASAKTLTDLLTEAFGILTGFDPMQDPAAEDLETIGKYVDPLIEQLSADNVITVSDTEAIPNEIFLPLARLLANIAGPRFGSPMNEDAKRVDEQVLRRIAAAQPTYEPVQAEYF